jgi:hypothetical protein
LNRITHHSEEELQLQWEDIWNNLHSLKGDLLIIEHDQERPSQNVYDVVDLIHHLRVSKEIFKENWSNIFCQVLQEQLAEL